MVDIASKPFNFTAVFNVGADNYTAHVNQAEWVPTQPTSSVTDLSGKVYNFGGKSGYVLNVAGFQDWATANAFCAFMNTNDGAEVTVSLEVPGGTWTGTVVGAAVTIGGTVNTPAVFNAALQTIGKPEFTPAV